MPILWRRIFTSLLSRFWTLFEMFWMVAEKDTIGLHIGLRVSELFSSTWVSYTTGKPYPHKKLGEEFQTIDYYSNTFYDHLRGRISNFLNNCRLSDIRNELDLSIPNFLPFIRAIFQQKWEQRYYRDWEDLAISIARWSARQCVGPKLETL